MSRLLFPLLLAKLTLDGNDELGNHWINFLSSVVDQVMTSLSRICLVGVLCLTESIEEQRKEEVVVDFIQVDGPADLRSSCQVLHLDGNVSTVVVHAEGGGLGTQEKATCRGGGYVDKVADKGNS